MIILPAYLYCCNRLTVSYIQMRIRSCWLRKKPHPTSKNLRRGGEKNINWLDKVTALVGALVCNILMMKYCFLLMSECTADYIIIIIIQAFIILVSTMMIHYLLLFAANIAP